MGDQPETSICAVCLKPSRANANLFCCENCSKAYHSGCNRLAPVTFDDGKLGKACSACITKAVPSQDAAKGRLLRRSNSHSGAHLQNTSSTSGSNLRAQQQSGSASKQDSLLQDILSEMRGLKSAFETSISEVKQDVNSRMDGLQQQLVVLDQIPQLVGEVQKHREDIEMIKKDIATLKLTQQATAEMHSKAFEQKIMELEKNNAELSSRLSAETSRKQCSSSTGIIIGGLAVPEGADVKAYATAALSAVHPDFQPHDIVAVRTMISRSAVRDAIDKASAGSDPTNSQAAPGSKGARSRNGTKKKPALPAATRPPSILVTLKSRPLLLAIMQDKLKLGKLHTSALTLPTTTPNEPAAPSLININEYLPGPIYRLHILVRQKARQPDSGFTCYVRDGQIFVRRRRSTSSVVINSPGDLDRFLDSPQL